MSAELLFVLVVAGLVAIGAVGLWIYSTVMAMHAKRRQIELPRRHTLRTLPSKWESRRYR
ncbi:MAG TPA: hypothetical protein VH105_11115 [Burkholderiales bacterium]|nr:hypothetical protein [Burkholderiales bacterium]